MSETSTADVRVEPGRSAAQRLAGDMAEVVRDEVRTVRSDLASKARPAASGLVLLGAAAGLALLGVGTASLTALRVMETFLPKMFAAAGLTTAYLTGAAFLGGAGVARLQEAGGGSRRLADQIREALRQTVGRPFRKVTATQEEVVAKAVTTPVATAAPRRLRARTSTRRARRGPSLLMRPARTDSTGLPIPLGPRWISTATESRTSW